MIPDVLPPYSASCYITNWHWLPVLFVLLLIVHDIFCLYNHNDTKCRLKNKTEAGGLSPAFGNLVEYAQISINKWLKVAVSYF